MASFFQAVDDVISACFVIFNKIIVIAALSRNLPMTNREQPDKNQ